MLKAEHVLSLDCCCIAGELSELTDLVQLPRSGVPRLHVELGRASASAAALHAAIRARRWEEAIKAVSVDAAADRDASGWNALHYAVAYNAPSRLLERLLLAHPNGAQERAGGGPLALLPLQLALARGVSSDIVSSLLAAYPAAARDHSKTDSGDCSLSQPQRPSVLMAAVLADDTTLVRMLLEAQADPNCRAHQPPHATCAMVAAERRSKAVLYQLLASGADVFARDDDGRTMLDAIPKLQPALGNEEEVLEPVSENSNVSSIHTSEDEEEQENVEQVDESLEDYEDDLRAARGRVSGRRGGITLDEAGKAAITAVALAGGVKTEPEPRNPKMVERVENDLLPDDEDERRLAQAIRSKAARRGAIYVDDRKAGAEATTAVTQKMASIAAQEREERAQCQNEAKIQRDPIVAIVLRAMEAQHTVTLTSSDMITLYDAPPIFDGDESGVPDLDHDRGSGAEWVDYRAGWGMNWGFTAGAWSKESPYYRGVSSVVVPDLQPDQVVKPKAKQLDDDNEQTRSHTPLRGVTEMHPRVGYNTSDGSGIISTAPGDDASGVSQVLVEHAVAEMREEMAGLRSQLAQALTGIAQLTQLVLAQTATVDGADTTTKTDRTDSTASCGVVPLKPRMTLDAQPLWVNVADSTRVSFAPPGDTCQYRRGRLVSIAARGGGTPRPLHRRNAARAWHPCYASLHAYDSPSKVLKISDKNDPMTARLVLTAEAIDLGQGAALAAAGYGLDLCQYEMAANGGVSDRIARTDSDSNHESTDFIELSPVNSQRRQDPLQGTSADVGPVALAFAVHEDWLYWARAIDAAMSIVRPHGPAWRKEAMRCAAIQTEDMEIDNKNEPTEHNVAGVAELGQTKNEPSLRSADLELQSQSQNELGCHSGSSRDETEEDHTLTQSTESSRVSGEAAKGVTNDPLEQQAETGVQESRLDALPENLEPLLPEPDSSADLGSESQQLSAHDREHPQMYSDSQPEPQPEAQLPEDKELQQQTPRLQHNLQPKLQASEHVEGHSRTPKSQTQLQPQSETVDTRAQRMRSLEERLAQARATRAARMR